MPSIGAESIDSLGAVPHRLQQRVVVDALQELVDLRFRITDFRALPKQLGQGVFQISNFAHGIPPFIFCAAAFFGH